MDRLVVGSLLLALVSACSERTPARYIPPAAPPAAAKPTGPDYRALSMKMRPGMTEAQAAELLGEPSETMMQSCGGRTGPHWQCKEKHYGNWFIVWYRYSPAAGGWVVNHWIVG